MKTFKMIFAAGLALFLTACSFFNNSENIEEEYQNISCQVSLTGGSGKASVESPAVVEELADSKTVRLVWSSPNYDYMIVDGVRYNNEAEAGENSVFTIPFVDYDVEFDVIADTTAMSTPHEIEYGLTVYSKESENEAAKEEEKSKEEASYDLGSLAYVDSLELDYAQGFKIDYYADEDKNSYCFISILATGSYSNNQYFLLVPEGKKVDVSDNVTKLERVDNTYLVSTSVMNYITKIDAIDNVRFSGTKESDWELLQAKQAMEDGSIIYSGKYSAPDYELLVTEGCNLAIENTMIFHSPETKEKLEELGIPVMVETSSYELSPLARLEWVKLYGAIYGRENEANQFFELQKQRIEKVTQKDATGKKIAFFSINSNGQIVVRRSNDYIAAMIDMAGGYYLPDDINDQENALSTVKMTAEDFYIRAVDADVLIYNSTIEGELSSIGELTAKLDSLEDFSAIKNKEVYCLKKDYFQKSTSVAEFIEELHDILTGSYKEGECFYKLKE